MLSADTCELVVCKAFGCVHEDIESSVRLNCVKSCINYVGVEEVTAVLVVSDVNLGVDGLLDDLLPDSRSIYASECSVRQNDCASKLSKVSALRLYESISDSLAGK